MKPTARLRLFLLGSALLAAPSLQAQLTWDITPGTIGAGDSAITGGLGAWNTTNGNWTADGGANNIAWVADETAVFGDTAGTVTLGTGISVGGLTFNTAGYTIATNTLTFGAAGNITTNADATISSILAGSVAVNKTGSGILELKGNNTYTGALTLSTGTLRTNSGNVGALGTGAATLVVNGGTLEFFDNAARNYARNTTIGGDAIVISNRNTVNQAGVTYTLGTLSVGANTVNIQGGDNVNSGTAGVTFGATTLTGAATFNVTNPTNGGITSLTFGAINNGGNLLTLSGADRVTTGDFTGAGGLTLDGGIQFFSNSFPNPGGNITLNGAVIQAVNAASITRALGAGSNQIQITGGASGFSDNGFAGATVNFGGAGASVLWGSTHFNPSSLVLLSSASQANGPGVIRNASITFANALDLNGAARSVQVNQIDNTILGNGATMSGQLTGTGLSALVKDGVGRLTLTNTNNDYVGGTTINGGTLRFDKIGSMPSVGNVTVNTGGTLGVRVGGASEWTTGTSGVGTIGGLLSGLGGAGSSTVSYSGNVGLEFRMTGEQIYSGNIGDVGDSLSIATFGTVGNTLVLSGNNTYTGPTRLNGGPSGSTGRQIGATLSISAANNLGVGGDLLFRGGVLQVTGTALTSLADLSRTVTFFDGMYVGFDIDNAANTFTVGQVLNNGTGDFNKYGQGTLVLNQANTYTGGTTITGGGGLVLDYTSANNRKLGTGAITLNNAGTITLKGGSTLENNTTSNVTLGAGHTSLVRDGGTSSLRLNSITRQAGGTISFADGTIADMDNLNVAGILGGYATVGSDWATNTPNTANGAIGALASYTPFDTAGGATNTNYSLTGASALTGALAARTLKITDTGAGQSLVLGSDDLTIASTNAVTIGGVMYAGGTDGNYTISGTGRIVPATANQELIFAVITGKLTVGAFVGAASASSPVTKSGAGTLVLSAANTYTGATRINGGTLALGNNDVFAATAFFIANATLDAATFTDTVGTLDPTANATINLGSSGAALAFAASNAVDWTGGKLNITGTFVSGSSLRFGTSNAGLTTAQLARISATGFTNFALDASGYLTADPDGPDVTPPTLVSIVDDQGGGPITVGTLVTYTVTFNEDMDAGTVSSADFSNAGSSTITIGTITETSPGVFTVQITPTSAGSLILQIPTTASMTDVATNPLDNDPALLDDTNITVNVADPYAAWSGGAAFEDDANGDGVDNGLAFLLGAANPNVSALDKLPIVTQSSGNLILTFSMLNSASRGSASLNVQHSGDLGISDPWTAVTVTDTSSGPTSGVTFTVTPGSPTNAVIATVSSSEAASGKLFGRLKAQP